MGQNKGSGYIWLNIEPTGTKLIRYSLNGDSFGGTVDKGVILIILFVWSFTGKFDGYGRWLYSNVSSPVQITLFGKGYRYIKNESRDSHLSHNMLLFFSEEDFRDFGI